MISCYFQVLRISSKTKEGIPQLWTRMNDFRDRMIETGYLDATRERQHKIWMWNHIRENIMSLFRQHPQVQGKVSQLEKLVATGSLTPNYAADILLAQFMQSMDDDIKSDTSSVKDSDWMPSRHERR